MYIQKILTTFSDDYIFNILDIENFNKETSYFSDFFNHLKKKHFLKNFKWAFPRAYILKK